MIDLYYWPTPNGHKVTMMLEECGLPYRLLPLNIAEGDQFTPEFLTLSPNARVPAIVDHAPSHGGPAQSVFESGAILLYLAEKSGKLLPADIQARTACLEWLFWQASSLSPMSAQMDHFTNHTPLPIPHAMERFDSEVRRLHRVMDHRLAEYPWLGGETYSIADIAAWPWLGSVARRLPDFDAFPHLARWYGQIAGRTAVIRAIAKGSVVLQPSEWQPVV